MPVSIRTSLLGNLVAMVVIIGIAILATTFLGSRRAVRFVSESIVTRTRETIEARLSFFFEGPSRQLLLMRDYGQSGMLDDERGVWDREISFLRPIIEHYPQISSAMIADGHGRECMLLRVGDGWRSRLSRRDEWGDTVRWLEWTNDDDRHERTETLDYDTRTRPWFAQAIEKRDRLDAPPDTIHWTEPYTFFTTREPGITASITYDLGDDVDHVIGLDFLLNDITEFTQALRIGRRGGVVVLTDDQRLIGLPPDPAVDAATALSDRATESGPVTIRFESGGEAWWGQVVPFHLSADERLWISIVVPEADLIGHLLVQRAVLFGIVVVVLGVGVLRAAFLARRFSAPIERLVAESDRMSRGDLEPGAPIVSNVAEVQRLARAHDTMRKGLGAMMRLEQVERELNLARDIQQGLLPDGPPDLTGFDIAGWNQPADLTGGDYYDWITLPDGRLVLTLADVTGHGIGPALIVAVCRAYVRASTVFGGIDLVKAVRLVNDLLYEDTPPERFVTAVITMLDPATSEMTIVSAGHGPLLFYEAGSGAVHRWDADVPPLGVMPGLEFPEPRSLKLHRGDVLALTTDGFFEWSNPAGEMWGIDRLRAFVGDNHDLTAEAFIETLYAAVLEHAQGTPQNDDLTAVIIRKL